MLQDRFYLGEVQYKGAWFEGHCEPIVSEGLLNRAREVRRRRRSGIGMKARKGSREYPLSGLARCARGGWPMRGRFSSGKRYYRDRREGSDRGDVASGRVRPALRLGGTNLAGDTFRTEEYDARTRHDSRRSR
ncbi:MAG: hypothetical protein GTO49_07590 [Anaerolineae bacterium]|nr:hypothetical protein [Anaerolineae bacterium]